MPHTESKKWNWQQENWPEFRYQRAALEPLEAAFLQQSGILVGTARHIGSEEMQQLTVEVSSDEAVSTSEIEGAILNRESVQSSIRRNFGLASDQRKIPPAEQGIAELRVELYRGFAAPLSQELLFHWHELLMKGRQDMEDVGRYRSVGDPMQIVSGPLHEPRVHFEAPPARTMKKEMTRFVQWFNETAPGGKRPLPALTRAGIAHWHFVAIHPFEDGNGRIARALAEKSLSQSLGHPVLIALSQVIAAKRNAYYDALAADSRDNEITGWLKYFAETILAGQALAQATVDFLIAKTRLFDRLRGQLNERQEKALARMFREGPRGFQGGLSAEKFMRITGTSRQTATRDLHDLVEKKALSRTGERKGTRYQLILRIAEA